MPSVDLVHIETKNGGFNPNSTQEIFKLHYYYYILVILTNKMKHQNILIMVYVIQNKAFNTFVQFTAYFLPEWHETLITIWFWHGQIPKIAFTALFPKILKF